MRLLAVIVVSVSSVVVAAGQVAPAVLSGALRAHVKSERFGTVVTAVRGLPLGVRNELETLFGSRVLDIADSGAAFQGADSTKAGLPTRRLSVAGCSIDHCLVYYEHGGKDHTWKVALFYWTPAATRFEWGGTAPGGLRTVDDVLSAVLSGAVRSADGGW
jgi:hypothetical protein